MPEVPLTVAPLGAIHRIDLEDSSEEEVAVAVPVEPVAEVQSAVVAGKSEAPPRPPLVEEATATGGAS